MNDELTRQVTNDVDTRYAFLTILLKVISPTRAKILASALALASVLSVAYFLEGGRPVTFEPITDLSEGQIGFSVVLVKPCDADTTSLVLSAAFGTSTEDVSHLAPVVKTVSFSQGTITRTATGDC